MANLLELVPHLTFVSVVLFVVVPVSAVAVVKYFIQDRAKQLYKKTTHAQTSVSG